MQRQRAAASLREWGEHLTALGCQHVDCRIVDAGKDQPLYASSQESHLQSSLADGRRPRRRAPHKRCPRDLGREGDERAQPFRQETRERGPAEYPHGAAQHDKRRQDEAETVRIGHDAEENRSENAVGQATLVVTLDLRTGPLDERPVLHAGWTGGYAGHTTQTRIEMSHERRRYARPSIGGCLHQIDAASRRIHLLAPEQVRRTAGQTEPAVYALVHERRCRRIDVIEDGLDCGNFVGCHRLRAHGSGLTAQGTPKA